MAHKSGRFGSDQAPEKLYRVDARRGIDNVSPETKLAEASVRRSVNVDVTKQNNLRRRPGYEEVLTLVDGGSPFANGDSFYVRSHGYINAVHGVPDAPTLTQVEQLSSATNPIHYVDVFGRTYWSNGSDSGALDGDTNSPWWVDTPNGQPTATATSGGGLLSGRYLVALTAEDSNGLESGSTVPLPVSIAEDGQSIELTDLPEIPAGTEYCLYVSDHNGKQMYLQGYYARTVTSIEVFQADNGGRELITNFYDPFPPAKFLTLYRGRMYGAVGAQIVFSPPKQYGFTKRARGGFMRLHTTDVQGIVAVEDGLYVAADKIYFLSGQDPDNFQVVNADATSVVSGQTMISVPGRAFAESVPEATTYDKVAYWLSKRGPCLGLPGGRVRQIGEGRFILPEGYDEAVAYYMERGGLKSIVNPVKGTAAASGFAATDVATMTVIRNGIEV